MGFIVYNGSEFIIGDCGYALWTVRDIVVQVKILAQEGSCKKFETHRHWGKLMTLGPLVT